MLSGSTSKKVVWKMLLKLTQVVTIDKSCLTLLFVTSEKGFIVNLKNFTFNFNFSTFLSFFRHKSLFHNFSRFLNQRKFSSPRIFAFLKQSEFNNVQFYWQKYLFLMTFTGSFHNVFLTDLSTNHISLFFFKTVLKKKGDQINTLDKWTL